MDSTSSESLDIIRSQGKDCRPARSKALHYIYFFFLAPRVMAPSVQNEASWWDGSPAAVLLPRFPAKNRLKGEDQASAPLPRGRPAPLNNTPQIIERATE